MKTFNLKHALTTRRCLDKEGNELWLTLYFAGDTKLKWVNIGNSISIESDLDGKVNEEEVLYSNEIIKSTQIVYAVKAKIDIDYTVVYHRDEYPNCTTRYEIIFNLEDNEIKSIEHKKIAKDE